MEYQWIWAVVIPILLAIIGLAYKYGILNARVKGNYNNVKELKECYDNLDDKLDSIVKKVTRIETILNGGSKKKRI